MYVIKTTIKYEIRARYYVVIALAFFLNSHQRPEPRHQEVLILYTGYHIETHIRLHLSVTSVGF